MFEGADQGFRVEGVLIGEGSRLARCRYGGVGEVLDEVFDYKVFTLCGLAGIVYGVFWQLTENLSSVNCGPRIDVLDVWCVRIEAVSMPDALRSEGSIWRRSGIASRYVAGIQCLLRSSMVSWYQVSAMQRFPEAGVLGVVADHEAKLRIHNNTTLPEASSLSDHGVLRMLKDVVHGQRRLVDGHE
jgi:hypothetical protein